jgi:coproporphyrinogen III oxidase-like Fe-S oxidoreductase
MMAVKGPTRVSAAPDSATAPCGGSVHFGALPPLSLYIHMPWCARKCPYCDFNSHEARAALPQERYLAALIADLESAAPRVWGRRIVSIFIGGGTPSLLSADAIGQVLSGVRARLPVAAGAEVTLEANPGSAEAGKFRDFRAAGVNRLSLGVQSFNPVHLRALGRVHDDREARRAIEMAGRSFDNFNLDLMYGLPGQTGEEALADIKAALSYGPPHVSAYHLTIEPNTYFHRYPPQLPDDDTAAAMQEGIEETLGAAGYEHYEVSAYAKLRREARGERREAESAAGDDRHASPLSPLSSPAPPRAGARCAHNMNYWTFGDYLGIGAGAHSKLSFADRIERGMRVKHPERYMEASGSGDPVHERCEVPRDDVPFEFMMNALRLNAGFAPQLFEERTGLPLAAAVRPLEEAQRRGLVLCDAGRIVPTALGRRFLNDLLQLFLTENTERA